MFDFFVTTAAEDYWRSHANAHPTFTRLLAPTDQCFGR
jgi:hypothetical protein